TAFRKGDNPGSFLVRLLHGERADPRPANPAARIGRQALFCDAERVLPGQFAGLSTGVRVVEEQAEANEHRCAHRDDAGNFCAAHACASCAALTRALTWTGAREAGTATSVGRAYSPLPSNQVQLLYSAMAAFALALSGNGTTGAVSSIPCFP